MQIPPSYLYVDPFADEQSRKRHRVAQAEASSAAASGPQRKILGLDRGLVSIAAVFIGIIGYGGLMELVL